MTDRDSWEKIAQKIESGEMPPKGVPRPPQDQMSALATFIRGQFNKADAAVRPDPGRVIAKRLNRNEYRNSIRDLLGVDFRAEKDFPTDDSGYGFDNIGEILTISPVLMEKYLNAAEVIASRAMGADPLPKKPLETVNELKFKTVRRLDYSTVETSQRIDYDGEYIVRFGFPGERGPDAKPVKMAFPGMDGQLLQTLDIETKPSKLVYFLGPVFAGRDARVPARGGSRFSRCLPERRLCLKIHDGQRGVQSEDEQVDQPDHVRGSFPVQRREGKPQAVP